MLSRNVIRSARVISELHSSPRLGYAASAIRLLHASTIQRTLNPSLSDRVVSNDDGAPLSHHERLFDYSDKYSTPLPIKFDRLHAHSMQLYPTNAGKTTVLELGTFMGYSAMAMADGMPKGATLYTCEKDPKAAKLSRDLFEEHAYSPSSKNPTAKRQDATIEVIEGDGLSSLALLAKKKLRFDAVFLDADKGNYVNYYNFILDNDMLSENGYILADNTLFSGLVLNSEKRKTIAAANGGASSSASKSKKNAVDGEWTSEAFQKFADHIDTFNKHVHNDPRVDVVLLPVFDGLSMIMKKQQ
ncbi:hypothetical protein BGX29_009612 [Mortierella sp. GBA35]|nr:hypothetical protein BGX29_009612 [Mortierella sp. GBA35]